VLNTYYLPGIHVRVGNDADMTFEVIESWRKTEWKNPSA
jgi:hypothetical protein